MKLAEVGFLFLLFVLLVVMPVGWFAATVSACGWKGLFIECRVMECQK